MENHGTELQQESGCRRAARDLEGSNDPQIEEEFTKQFSGVSIIFKFPRNALPFKLGMAKIFNMAKLIYVTFQF